MSSTTVTSYIDKLEVQCSASWASIRTCRTRAREERVKIEGALNAGRLVPADTAFVVFGSLAREEWTEGSDLDWTLLVDGQADQSHLSVAQLATERLKELGYKPPGRDAVFGGPTFSHELVHRIGGEHDSNKNTTKRILLLLESANIGSGDLVRNRVVTQLFKRYVTDDHGYTPPGTVDPYVPRFLLNDVVRYWRTMAVDFAAKRRERAGDGWALRNFKLRMSRKMIFAAGLAMCISCELRPSARLVSRAIASDEDLCAALVAFLVEFANRSPLEILARTAVEFEARPAGKLLYDAYDAFLRVLSDQRERERLESLGVDDAHSDLLFRETREIGTAFQEGLTKLFFDSDPALTRSSQRYGVF